MEVLRQELGRDADGGNSRGVRHAVGDLKFISQILLRFEHDFRVGQRATAVGDGAIQLRGAGVVFE